MSAPGGENNERAEYGNKHRAFLQALFSRQTITFEEAKPLIAAIESCENPERPVTNEDVTQVDFESYIYAVNNEISPFDYEIRASTHQITKERVYALVNTTSDALTQMSTIHTADEIAFVKRVLDAMFDTYNTPQAEIMAVTSMQALKLAKDPSRRAETQTQSTQAGLTMAQAEKVMSDMVHEGWFELSGNGYFSLSPRALMELRSWLIDTYNESPEEVEEDEEPRERIKTCTLCRDIVTIGQRCPNLDCNTRAHDYCVRNMFRAHRDSEKCPSCKTDWMDAPLVGEKAATSRSRGAQRPGHGSSTQRSTNGAAGRRRGGIDVSDDSDADVGSED